MCALHALPTAACLRPHSWAQLVSVHRPVLAPLPPGLLYTPYLQVLTAGGGTKLMSEVAVGDEILSAADKAGGGLGYRPVYFLAHADHSEVESFVELHVGVARLLTHAGGHGAWGLLYPCSQHRAATWQRRGYTPPGRQRHHPHLSACLFASRQPASEHLVPTTQPSPTRPQSNSSAPCLSPTPQVAVPGFPAARTLRLTPRHFIPVLTAAGKWRHSYAKDVAVGGTVHVLAAGSDGNGTASGLVRGVVTRVTSAVHAVVDGVLASDQSDWVLDDLTPAHLAHLLPTLYSLLFAPLRWAYFGLGAPAWARLSPALAHVGHHHGSLLLLQLPTATLAVVATASAWRKLARA